MRTGTTGTPKGAPRKEAGIDAAHVFVTERAEMEKVLKNLRPLLTPGGFIWVSWPKKASRVKVSARDLRYIDRALQGTSRTGTMAWRLIDFPLDKVRIRSKTGSAEVYGKQSTSWVASYDDRYAVVMMVSQGGTGSGTSGPAIRKIWETLYGVRGDRVETYRVPGAFELPLAARALARTGRFSAIICLGAVVRGETPHFEYVSGECARGIADDTQQTVGFRARAGLVGGDLGYIKYGVFVGDNRTFSITLATPSADDEPGFRKFVAEWERRRGRPLGARSASA